MLTLISLSFSLFFIVLTGWTLVSYVVKESSQKYIQEELKNLFDICKMFFASLKSLIRILATHSFPSDSSNVNPPDSNGVGEQFSTSIQPIGTPLSEVPIMENEDTELNSFSQELIEVITEEEEKIA